MEQTPQTQEKKINTPLLLIGTLIVLTVGTSLIPASWFGIKPQTRVYEPLKLSSLADPKNVAQDANNDGVISWKEFIASSLGEPDLATSTTRIETNPRTVAALNDPNNLTSSFTKNLYMASVALEQGGITDSQTEQQVVTDLIQKESEKLPRPTYTQADVKVSNDNSTAALKAYGNAVAEILDGLITEKSITDDLTATITFIQSENEGDLTSVLASRKKVDSAMQKLLSLSVPGKAVPTHVQVLNNIGTFDTTLQNLTKAYDDPVRATFALKTYSDDAITALHSIPILSQFFNQSNIVFSGKDAGYLFTAGYTTK